MSGKALNKQEMDSTIWLNLFSLLWFIHYHAGGDGRTSDFSKYC